MKKFITVLIVVHCSLLTAHFSLAQIIHVPEDQPTIQAGINAAANGDTVLVAPGWYYESINFSGKNIIVASHFLITSNPDDILQTKIIGDNSNSNVTISGGVDSTALLCGFQVRNGNSSNGAGIYCQNASPRLRDLQVLYNQADYSGGGIYLDQADPVIQNVTVLHNKADYGGGIFMASSFDQPELINVRIEQNLADHGGGMYCSSSNPSLSSVTIKVNVAEYSGGGMVVNSYTPWLIPLFDGDHSCSIYNNVADEAIDISTNISFDLVLDTFSVAIPTDYYASALFMISYDVLHGINYQVDADLYIAPWGSDINSGLSTDDPLKTLDKAFSIIVADSQYDNTIYLLDGTYTYLEYPVQLPDFITLEGTDKTVVVLDADDTWNVIKVADNSYNLIRNLTISNGQAPAGGGMYCTNSSLTLQDLIISNNSAPIYMGPETWYGGYGGGIYCTNSELNLSNIEFSNNDALWGGGMYCEQSDIYLNSASYSGNLSDFVWLGWGGAGGSGGALYCQSSHFEIASSRFEANEADMAGGAICASNMSTLILQNTYINGNIAGGGYFQSAIGAGILLSDESEAILKNVSLSGNTSEKEGGAIYCIRSETKLYNVTITDNSAFTGGAAYYADSSSAEVINSILWQNQPDEIVCSDSGRPDSISVLYSDISGGLAGIVTHNNAFVTWGAGNIDEDPQFYDLDPYPYQLSEGSPCIDEGTTDTTGLFLPAEDIIGNMRFWDADGDGDTIVDMGAYEFGSIPVGVIEPKGQKPGVKSQNYPNPFSISTTFTFQLEQYSVVNVKIFNSTGQKIDEIRLSSQSPGKHEIIWNAEGTPAGIYYYRLQAGKSTEAGKMILMK